MLQRGHEVQVISLSEPNDASPIYADLQTLNLEVHWLPLRTLVDLRGLHTLTAMMKAFDPQIVHTQLNYANIHGTLAAKQAGIPAVASLHNASVHLYNYRPYRTWMETWILHKFSQRIIACGYTVARVQQHRFPNKELIVIPNPVPEQPESLAKEKKRIRSTYLPGGEGILVISVGRLIPEKGYSDLIHAMTLVRQSYSGPIKLLIAGKGYLIQDLQREIEEADLQTCVELLGERSDVPLLLAASDIYLSGSHYEGQSLAVLEAMDSGLPVVVTDVGDNQRVVARECGLVLPAGQPDLLARQIIRLAQDPQARSKMGGNARLCVRKNFSAEKWVDQLLALYTEVLNG